MARALWTDQSPPVVRPVLTRETPRNPGKTVPGNHRRPGGLPASHGVTHRQNVLPESGNQGNAQVRTKQWPHTHLQFQRLLQPEHLEQVFMDSFFCRLHPVAPGNIRTSTKEIVLSGYKIPAGVRATNTEAPTQLYVFHSKRIYWLKEWLVVIIYWVLLLECFRYKLLCTTTLSVCKMTILRKPRSSDRRGGSGPTRHVTRPTPSLPSHSALVHARASVADLQSKRATLRSSRYCTQTVDLVQQTLLSVDWIKKKAHCWLSNVVRRM